MHSSSGWAFLATAVPLGACAAGSGQRPSVSPGAEPYDLLIRGGRVIDGTGSP